MYKSYFENQIDEKEFNCENLEAFYDVRRFYKTLNEEGQKEFESNCEYVARHAINIIVGQLAMKFMKCDLDFKNWEDSVVAKTA